MNGTRHILILEDNDERIASFENVVVSLPGDWNLKVWRDAPSMIAECARFFPTTFLISLDHDLNRHPDNSQDPGTGVDVTKYLSLFPPVCPVILHSSNHERVYSMHNELRFAGWHSERVGPTGNDWIEKAWMTKATEFLREALCHFEDRRPANHEERMHRVLTSLCGLAIGDALGEMLAYKANVAPEVLKDPFAPPGPWFHTDDTEMALSVVEVLKHHGFIQQDSLARRFARRFEIDPDRGYGKMTRVQMREVLAGSKWHDMARSAFGGQGSMGNGGAMRVAPLGAYFADDLEALRREAVRSSEVTHTHPEGIAGTIAVAAAAAVATRYRQANPAGIVEELFSVALDLTPASEVRTGIERARKISFDSDPIAVGKTLGNGSLVTAPDTVPYAIWCAARHIGDYPMALATAICTGGDCDTNAAIVGGTVALAVGSEDIPVEWRREVEPFRFL